MSPCARCGDGGSLPRVAHRDRFVPGANTVADGLAAGEVAYGAAGATTRLADMGIGYDAAGQHASTTYDDGSTVRIARDATGRIVERTIDPVGAAPAVSTRYLYDGDDDLPFGQTSSGALIREVSLPGGAQVSLTSGGATWQYPSLLGHTVTTGDGSVDNDYVWPTDPIGKSSLSGLYVDPALDGTTWKGPGQFAELALGARGIAPGLLGLVCNGGLTALPDDVAWAAVGMAVGTAGSTVIRSVIIVARTSVRRATSVRSLAKERDNPSATNALSTGGNVGVQMLSRAGSTRTWASL